MINIGSPTVYIKNEKAYLTADVHIPMETALRYKEITKTLKNCPWRTQEDYPPKTWENGVAKLHFEVDKKYEDCLCTERSDAFVMALFWYAMVTGEDICFEVPMSERLHSGLTQRLIPALCKDGHKHIKLTGPVTSEKLECKDAVGTGMSCGVDSFYTMRTHKLTHLAFYGENWTAFSILKFTNDTKRIYLDYDITDKEVEKETNKMVCRASEIAKKAGLEFIFVKNNLDKNFYRGATIYTKMYFNLTCTLAVQKLFSTYYSSSSGNGGNLETGLFVPTQNYENLICDNCKTETLDFISSDDARRFDKIEKIADDSEVAKYLDVCFAPLYLDMQFHKREKNCGECYGCLKTMVVLDLLGKLDQYEKVFELKNYYADRRKYIKILADGSRRPESSALRVCWADIVKYAKAHSGELCEIILELDMCQ